MSNRRTFVRVYDDLHEHPKWMSLEPEHIGLWVLALGYCSRNLTDGAFPAKAVRRWGGTDEQVSVLLEHGRLHAAGHDCRACPEVAEGDLYVHDYLQHQRSKADATALSEKRAEAGRRGGKARHGQAPDLQEKQGAKQVAKQESGNVKQTATIDRDIDIKDTPAAAAAAAIAADFEAWWQHYPRKVGKSAAAKAYTKAHKAVGPFVLATGLRNALAEWQAARTEGQYLPHPATWLNQGRWADEHPTLEATNQPARPSVTVNLCDGTACPGDRHEWTDARNRYLCMGV